MKGGGDYQINGFWRKKEDLAELKSVSLSQTRRLGLNNSVLGIDNFFEGM